MSGRGPRARNIVVGLVVSLWAVSVIGQMAATAFGREWVAPAGLNELATAVVMGLLAATHQAGRGTREGGDDGE